MLEKFVIDYCSIDRQQFLCKCPRPCDQLELKPLLEDDVVNQAYVMSEKILQSVYQGSPVLQACSDKCRLRRFLFLS